MPLCRHGISIPGQSGHNQRPPTVAAPADTHTFRNIHHRELIAAMDLATIKQRIDAGANADDIRAELGEKIMECLVAKGEILSPWERIHFGMAIDLLRSPWLSLTWTHVDAVCSRSDSDPDLCIPRPVENAPTLAELFSQLIQALADVHQHKTRMAFSLRDPVG